MAPIGVWWSESRRYFYVNNLRQECAKNVQDFANAIQPVENDFQLICVVETRDRSQEFIQAVCKTRGLEEDSETGQWIEKKPAATEDDGLKPSN